MTKIFFTGDTHFGHKNILKFSPNTRKFSTIEDMNETIIRNWQNTVSIDDVVYIHGDFAFMNADDTARILDRLPGHKILIEGNHDKTIMKNQFLRDKFDDISVYREVVIDRVTVCMFHFPIYEWNKAHHGSYHTHGHTHGHTTIPGRVLDVGLDSRPDGDCTLWTWEEIHATLSTKPVRDHH